MTRSQKRKWIGLVVVAGLVFLALVLVQQSETIKRVALDRIDRTFGQSIRFQDLEVSLFPHPSVELREVTIRPHKSVTELKTVSTFQIRSVRLEMGFLALVTETMQPTRLLVQEPQIQLILSSPDQMEGVGLESSVEQVLAQAFSMMEEVSVRDGTLIVHRLPAGEGPPLVHLKELDLSLTPPTTEGVREVQASGVSSYAEEVSPFSLEGTLHRMRSPVSIGPAKPEGVFPKLVLAGEVEVTNLPVQQVTSLTSLVHFPKENVRTMTLQGAFRLAPGLQGYDVSLPQFALRTKALILTGHGNVSGVFGDEPSTVLLTISSNPVSFQDLLPFVPENVLPEILSDVINRGLVGGTFSIVSAQIAGTSRPDVGYSVKGKVHLRDGWLTVGDKWGMAKQIAGTFNLENERLHFSDITALYDEDIPISSAEGSVDLSATGLPLDVTLTGDVPVIKLMDILHQIFPPGTKGKRGWWASLAGREGGGMMTIRFQGPLITPEQVKFRHALYHVKGGSLVMDTLTLPLREISGAVEFSPQHIAFDSLTGLWGRSDVRLIGQVTFRDGAAFDQLRLQSAWAPGEFLQQFWPHIEPERFVSGVAPLDMVLNGPVETAHVRGTMDLGLLGLDWSGVMHKAPTVQGALKFEGQVQPKGNVQVHRLDLSVPPLHVATRGTVRLTAPFGIVATMNLKPFDVTSFSEGFQIGSDILQGGRIELSGTVNGLGWDWRLWEKSGWIAVTNGVVHQQGLDRPAEDIYLRLQLAQHQAEVKRLEFRMGDSRAQVTGMIHEWDQRPKAQLALQSPRFDLDLLIPKGDRSPLRDALEYLAAETQIDAQLRFTTAWYKELNFEELDGEVSLGNGMVDVARIRGKMGKGTVGGRLFVDLPRNEPATVKTRLEVQTIPLESLQRTFFAPEILQERLVTGWLTASGVLEGHGRDPGGIMPTINGTIDATLTDGYIQRGTVVPKVLALLHLPRVLQGKVDFAEKGFPFDRSHGTLTIKNGVISSDDIVLSGPVLTMTGAGTYRLVDHQINLVTAISPLGPYSNLLRKIPLFGALLEGDREAIDTAMFTIQGSVHQPKITYLPLKSFTAGLTGLAKMAYFMLKNTVTLPGKLLTPSKTDSKTSVEREKGDIRR